MRECESCLTLPIRDFIAYRKAPGHWNEVSYRPSFRVSDRFCAMDYPDLVRLTQEMVDRWCRRCGSEINDSHRSWIYVVCSFIKYLSERGLFEALPPRIPRKERVAYIPCALSGDEIRSFFEACDNLPDIPKTRDVLIRCIMVPVFLRLLYSSNTCTIGARPLEYANVDIGNGVLSVRYSKGHDQHYIALHDSMVDLMHRYDSVVREWSLSRRYFFPAPGDTAHPHTRVEKNFQRVRAGASSDRTVTAYVFRHHYTTVNINHWIGGGFAPDDKLTCLGRSMGHATLESARYYYSAVLGLSGIVPKKTEDDFNELVPEVIS